MTKLVHENKDGEDNQERKNCTEDQIHEIKTDGAGFRQISKDEHPDVDNFDGCYLPDGRIVYASTASFTGVPCWHGKERACSLYLMDGNGENVRQLCFDQDLDLHPAVLPNGQIIFSRWDYTGIMHIYLRPLMVMNPDGTGQRAAYGSNSYWPNALYYLRGIPDAPGKIVAIMAGYHGPPRMGELALIDLLVIGSPTHGALPTEAMQVLVRELRAPADDGALVAAFDTRLSWGFLRKYGFAADRLAEELGKTGWTLRGAPAGFFVRGLRKGPLKKGEVERAANWARGLVGSDVA